MTDFAYHKPSTLDEALVLKEQTPEAAFVAGATDVYVHIRAKRLAPPALISLRGLPELRGVELGERTWIGAGTTITEILNHAELAARFPILRDAARPFASVQIRNAATVGGNICNASPAADMAPALLALDASVAIAGRSCRREVPLAHFMVARGKVALEPDEIVVGFEIPPAPPNLRSAYMRMGRVAMDLALVGVGVALVLDGRACKQARVAACSVAPKPIRLPRVERLLEGELLDAARIAAAREEAASEVAPISDVRCSEEYRRKLAGVLVQRAIQSVLEEVPR